MARPVVEGDVQATTETGGAAGVGEGGGAGTSKRWLSPNEAAIELGVTPRTIYSWTRSGELPAAHVGGLVRIDRRQIEVKMGQHIDPAVRRRRTRKKRTT